MKEEIPARPEAVQAMPYGIRFGIVGGLLCVVISVLLYIGDLQFESWSRWLSTLALLGTIVVGLRTIVQEHPGQEVSFGTLSAAGMIITALVTVITVSYFFIYLAVIDPDFIQATMEVSRAKMVEAGMSEDQIERAIQISEKIMTPTTMGAIAAVTTLVLGGLCTIICAAIFKQEK